MSRILRRPMFRGGPVSSYGTGIASGLADGGRVGFDNGGDVITGGQLQNFRSSPSYNPKNYKFYTGRDDKRYVTDYIPQSAEDLRIFQERSKWKVPSIEDIDQKIQDEVETIDFNRVALDSSGQISGDTLPTQFIETEAGQEKRREELIAERAEKINQMKEYGIVVPGEGHPSEGIDATGMIPQKGVEEVKKVEEVNQNGNKIIETEESTTINEEDIKAHAALFDRLLNEDYEKEKKSAQIGDASDYALQFFKSTVGEGKGIKEAAGDVAGRALTTPSRTEKVQEGKKKTKQTATVMAINEAIAQGKSARDIDMLIAKSGLDLKNKKDLVDYGQTLTKGFKALATHTADSKKIGFVAQLKDGLRKSGLIGYPTVTTTSTDMADETKFKFDKNKDTGRIFIETDTETAYVFDENGKKTPVA